MPAPATSSRHLYTGRHQGHEQAAPWLRASSDYRSPLSRGPSPILGFGAVLIIFDASAVVHTCSSSRHTPDPVSPGLFPKRSPPRLLTVAASGGLGSPPARRARRVNLHHWHSTVRAGGFYVTITLLSGHTTRNYAAPSVAARGKRPQSHLHGVVRAGGLSSVPYLGNGNGVPPTRRYQGHAWLTTGGDPHATLFPVRRRTRDVVQPTEAPSLSRGNTRSVALTGGTRATRRCAVSLLFSVHVGRIIERRRVERRIGQC